MLIEAAWSYRLPARISRVLLRQQEALARPIREIAWKAQDRLCRRYRTLQAGSRSAFIVPLTSGNRARRDPGEGTEE